MKCSVLRRAGIIPREHLILHSGSRKIGPDNEKQTKVITMVFLKRNDIPRVLYNEV